MKELELRQKVQQHILDSVEDREMEAMFLFAPDACLHLYKTFIVESSPVKSKAAIKLEEERFSDYLNGLPFGFEFENEKITSLLSNLGLDVDSLSYTEATKLYHSLIYREVKHFVDLATKFC